MIKFIQHWPRLPEVVGSTTSNFRKRIVATLFGSSLLPVFNSSCAVPMQVN